MTIRSDSRHLYLQVIDRIKRDIDKGTYREKEKLPSEYELSKLFGVSRATLREALRILEEENIVTRRHGVGTFVNAKPVFTSGIEELFSVTDMISRAGLTPGSQYLSTDILDPIQDDFEKFSKKNFKFIVEIERIRTADGHPVVYCIDKVPSSYISMNNIHNEVSLFSLIEEKTNKQISYAVTYIEPVGYHEKISPMLKCEPEESLLLLKQMHYNVDDIPVLYSKNYFRTNQFNFYVLRKRV